VAIELTDEIRQAVHDEDCARLGHQVRTDRAVFRTEAGDDVRGPDGQLAHIRCIRCQKAWLVVEEPGSSYDDAVTKFKAKLKNPDDANPKPR
jgi:hypothetical protein